MSPVIPEYFNGVQSLVEAINAQLSAYSAPRSGCPTRLNEAIRYSLLAPGKRLRPLLALAACEAVSGEWRRALPVACAVEFVHVYSLIHDDLPAMDDDDLRRGQPTCHRKYDEATAILAGDALQMLAIEVISGELPAEQAARCCQILATAAGCTRLVGGQADDLAAEGRFGEPQVDSKRSIEVLSGIHDRKTGALIQASLVLGGVVGDASSDHLERLSRYGASIGLAFQIVDDCLDVEATSEQMGKRTRKDSDHNKMTYPGLIGLAESRKMAQQLIGDACEAIAVFQDRASKLIQLAEFVVQRRS